MCETKTNSRIGNSYIKEELKSKYSTEWVTSLSDYLPYNFPYKADKGKATVKTFEFIVEDGGFTGKDKVVGESIGVVPEEKIPTKEEIGEYNYKNYSYSHLVDNVIRCRANLVKGYALYMWVHLSLSNDKAVLMMVRNSLRNVTKIEKRLRKSLKELKSRGVDIDEIQKDISFKYPKKDIEKALIIIGDWIKKNS